MRYQIVFFQRPNRIIPSPNRSPSPILSSQLTSSLHHLVELAFDVELGVLGFDTFQFDGHLFTSCNVGSCAETRVR